MADRRVDGFFYGLFMDREVLSEHQVAAVNPRRAYVDGYALRIGRRSTLLPTSAGRVYGMVYAVTHEELGRLYGAPGLEPYRPEAVLARTMEGEPLAALCYTLPEPPGPGDPDPGYAARLRAVLGKYGFPPAYVASVG